MMASAAATALSVLVVIVGAATTVAGQNTPPAAVPVNIVAPGAIASFAGSGSTALQPFLQNALGRGQATSEIKVSLPYSAVGSGGGQTNFLAGTTRYGVSDVSLSQAQFSGLGARQVIQIPALLNTVSLFVNITGVSRLSLTADLVAQIFQGTITSFNNPAIVALNPGLVAPAVNITVVTRLESSGTTALFSEYLDKASDLWTLGTGFTVAFPDIVRSVTGTGSVVSAVSAVGNSIGYASSGAGLAAGLTEVAITNAAGQFITSGAGNYNATASTITFPPPTGDWSGISLVNLPGQGTYPIAGLAFYLVDAVQPANATGALGKQLFSYLLSSDVQASTTLPASGLRPLPTAALAAAQRAVAAIQAPATPAYDIRYSKPAVETGVPTNSTGGSANTPPAFARSPPSFLRSPPSTLLRPPATPPASTPTAAPTAAPTASPTRKPTHAPTRKHRRNRKHGKKVKKVVKKVVYYKPHHG